MSGSEDAILIDEPLQVTPEEQAEWWARCMGARIRDEKLVVIQSRTCDADQSGCILDSTPWPLLRMPE